jgi:hypothetical protein
MSLSDTDLKKMGRDELFALHRDIERRLFVWSEPMFTFDMVICEAEQLRQAPLSDEEKMRAPDIIHDWASDGWTQCNRPPELSAAKSLLDELRRCDPSGVCGETVAPLGPAGALDTPASVVPGTKRKMMATGGGRTRRSWRAGMGPTRRSPNGTGAWCARAAGDGRSISC